MPCRDRQSPAYFLCWDSHNHNDVSVLGLGAGAGVPGMQYNCIVTLTLRVIILEVAGWGAGGQDSTGQQPPLTSSLIDCIIIIFCICSA